MGKVITPNVAAWRTWEHEGDWKREAVKPCKDGEDVGLAMAADILGVPLEAVARNLEVSNHILLAWGIYGYGEHASVEKWYLPQDAPKWVYYASYSRDLPHWFQWSRQSGYKAYKTLAIEGPAGYRYFKVCAPLGLLLGNKALRDEYLAGKLGLTSHAESMII